MGVFCLNVCLCILCVYGAHRGQKRVLGPLELEIQELVSCHVSSRSETSALKGRASLQSHKYNFKSPWSVDMRWCQLQQRGILVSISAAGPDLPRGGIAHVKRNPWQRELRSNVEGLLHSTAQDGSKDAQCFLKLQHEEH